MHKTLTISVDELEYSQIKNFVNQFGGLAAFFRQALKEKGYQKESLKDVARRCRESNLAVYKEWEGTLGDGLEKL